MADRGDAEAAKPLGRARRGARGKADGLGFLVGQAIDSQALAEAERLGTLWGVPAHRALLATGRVRAERYAALLARHLKVGHFDLEAARRHPLTPLADAEPRQARTKPRGSPAAALEPIWEALARAQDGRLVIDATILPPRALGRFLAGLELPRHRIALASPRLLREAVLAHRARPMVRRAVLGLARIAPALSAASGLWTGQAVALASLAGLALGGALVAPEATLRLLSALVSLPILAVVLLRAGAVLRLALAPLALTRGQGVPRRARLPDAALPVYTILVPLFREAHMLPQLVAALGRLDYPPARLDIKLILESIDLETRRAAEAMALPPHFEIVTVPDRQPRTKPKALAFALQRARGDFVVVFDAEDIPEPDQLRLALAAFAEGGPQVVCVQAGLDIYNPWDGWLTRQFTLEYAALFAGLLPFLERLALPLPLGGTSNHFRRSALERLGGWDPFNVTEDADLGMRLARMGYRCRVIASTTFEEAPNRLGEWFRQRTRWMKGWMQTALVHSRQPARALGGFGPWGFVGFHLVLGALLVSVLLHPLFYLVMAADMATGRFLDGSGGLLGETLRMIALGNLIGGYAAAMALAARAAIGRGLGLIALDVATMPFYWLLISAAAWRALFQLFADPFRWEKTAHGFARPARGPGVGEGRTPSSRQRSPRVPSASM